MAKLPRRWLTKKEQQLWRSYLMAQFRLKKYLNDDVESNSGFDSLTYEIFVHLSESVDWSLRMNDLATRVSTTKSALTYRITQLEKIDMVKRVEAPEDKRGQLCQLTEKGFEKLKAAAPFHVESVLTQFIDKLEGRNIDDLKDFFDAIASQVDAQDF